MPQRRRRRILWKMFMEPRGRLEMCNFHKLVLGIINSSSLEQWQEQNMWGHEGGHSIELMCKRTRPLMEGIYVIHWLNCVATKEVKDQPSGAIQGWRWWRREGGGEPHWIPLIACCRSVIKQSESNFTQRDREGIVLPGDCRRRRLRVQQQQETT